MNILLLTSSEYLCEYELTALKEIKSSHEEVHFQLSPTYPLERIDHCSKLISKIDKRFSNYPVSSLKQTHFNKTSFNIRLIERIPVASEIDFVLILGGLNSEGDISKTLKDFSVYTFHYSEKLLFSNCIKQINNGLHILHSPKGEVGYFKVRHLTLNPEKGVYNCRDKYLFYAGLYLGKQISRLEKSSERFSFNDASVIKKNISLFIWLNYIKLSIQIINRKLDRTELNWRIQLKKENNNYSLPQPENTFWADPFLLQKEDNFFIFFEELVNQKGIISVIKLNSELEYISKEPALIEDYHLSFPNVFEKDGRILMLPESSAGNILSIYESVNFPTKWEKKIDLFTKQKLVDAVWIFHNDLYWIFANVINDFEADNNEQLHIFYSNDLLSKNWETHQNNPVITDIGKSRNAGLIRNENGKLIRVSQNCKTQYGGSLVYNEIISLTPNSYEEKILKSDYPPTQFVGMHTYNSKENITVFDLLKKEKIKSR